MTNDEHPLVTVIKARQMLERAECADELDGYRHRFQTALEELDHIVLAEVDTIADLLEESEP